MVSPCIACVVPYGDFLSHLYARLDDMIRFVRDFIARRTSGRPLTSAIRRETRRGLTAVGPTKMSDLNRTLRRYPLAAASNGLTRSLTLRTLTEIILTTLNTRTIHVINYQFKITFNIDLLCGTPLKIAVLTFVPSPSATWRRKRCF